MLNIHPFSYKHIMNKFALGMKLESRKRSLAEALLTSVVLVSFVTLIRKLLHSNKLVMTDSLTGFPNQRALIVAIDRELKRARRYHRTFAILFLDVDYFKPINDSYGHKAGNEVLREFAKVVRSLLRRNDTLGRWGGDEFLIILPDTEEVGAQQVVERIDSTLAKHLVTLPDTEEVEIQQVVECVRSTLANHLLVNGSGFHLTCSIGVATFPSSAQGRELLIDAADQAMYIAKCQAHKHKYATPTTHVLKPESSRLTQNMLEVALR